MAITFTEDVREENIADLLQWISFILSLVMTVFFAREIKYGICGWEVAYVAVLESIIYIVSIGWEEYSPATIYLTNGAVVPWIRYLEWLLTCPVILIALSRVGTLEAAYSKSTMKLQTSDQGTIIMGIMAASSTGITNVGFYLCGLTYGFTTFYTAAGVYLEAYRNVPDDCRDLIKYMAYSFYGGWLMFPLLFILGPEGAGHISPDGSTIGHSVADLLSKNIWGIFEWQLDVKLHMHTKALQEEEEAANAVDDEGNPILAPADIVARFIILDSSGTIGAFFSEEFKKVGAEADIVKTVTQIPVLLEELEEDEDPYEFVLLSAGDMADPMVNALKNEHNLPLVVFATEAQQDDEALDLADDIIPIPVFGMPYNNSQILTVFVKYCKKQAKDMKDLMIMTLFDEITGLKEKMLDAGITDTNVPAMEPVSPGARSPAMSSAPSMMNEAPMMQQPPMMMQQHVPQMQPMGNMMGMQQPPQPGMNMGMQQPMGMQQLGMGMQQPMPQQFPPSTNQAFSFV
mmetsp:Transcript_26896/g.58675  ORF Transcript_26896/g.58675 Transcript_26896/m.58675 type:complete len:515 (-) Transcript_26896:444-1988(-)|eukprot:CAMPEP_0118922452 /NCGR_PEP_ID=MMETSP1169-20130426/1373_1 /TAXON_ID=36882 /ORGANISM="Pyramimonas obovata, Strain CCMP722" /LENGTH=514 /DNA_ID=CAMNT_0006863321 /DNA_START=148 /DNA_END=1692 /DNA_ORIENTATION=+